MKPRPDLTKKCINPKTLKQARTYKLKYGGIFEDRGHLFVKWKVHTSGSCGINTHFYHRSQWELSISTLIEAIYYTACDDNEKSVYNQIHRVLKIDNIKDEG